MNQTRSTKYDIPKPNQNPYNISCSPRVLGQGSNYDRLVEFILERAKSRTGSAFTAEQAHGCVWYYQHVSRSTVNRLINQAIKSGWLTRMSGGKCTYYQINRTDINCFCCDQEGFEVIGMLPNGWGLGLDFSGNAQYLCPDCYKTGEENYA